MRKITVIIRDNYPGYLDPLIYTVEVNDPKDYDEVHHAVAVQRADDIGCSSSELDLDLLLAFEGDINHVADWRE